MLLESFIATQKLSVQKTLARKFGRFVSFRRDCAELLLATLQASDPFFLDPSTQGLVLSTCPHDLVIS